MATKKKPNNGQSAGKITAEPEWGPGMLLQWLSMRLAAGAKKLSGVQKDRGERLARVTLALADTFLGHSDETLAEFDRVASSFLRQRARAGLEVGRVTGTKRDRDRDLVRLCGEVLSVFGQNGEKTLDALNLKLRIHGFADGMDREELERRLTELPIIGDMPADQLARDVLRALGATRARLKNFGK